MNPVPPGLLDPMFIHIKHLWIYIGALIVIWITWKASQQGSDWRYQPS